MTTDRCTCGRHYCTPHWTCPRCGPRCDGEIVLAYEDAADIADVLVRNLGHRTSALPWRCFSCWSEVAVNDRE